MSMQPGEAEPYGLSQAPAANDNRRRALWRRAVAAAVIGSFTLMLVSLGFNRYAHHPAYGSSHPLLPSN
jgi:hypothetical protein